MSEAAIRADEREKAEARIVAWLRKRADQETAKANVWRHESRRALAQDAEDMAGHFIRIAYDIERGDHEERDRPGTESSGG